MRLLKNFVFFKDIFKYSKFKGILKILNLQGSRKKDYTYYQKFISTALIFFILFNLGFRVPFSQFFGKAHAENKEFYNLVSVIVDDDIYSSVDGVLKRYAKDIETVLKETKVVLVPTPKDASAFQIASLIESLYYEGYKSVDKDADFESKLVGTLLVGDIPLPVVQDGANFSKTILPYTDFDKKSYVYDSDEGIYIKAENNNISIEPEIWHGVVSPNTGDEDDDIKAIKDYFDKNHDFYEGKGLFDREKGVINGNIEDTIPGELSFTGGKIDKDLDEYAPFIFYFDQFREKEGINTLNYKGYKSAQKNKEDLAYNRLTKEQAEAIKEEVLGEEEQNLSKLIVESFSGTELPEGKKIEPAAPVTPEEAAEDRYHCRFPNVGAFYGKDITVTFNGSCKHAFTVEDGSVRKEFSDGRLWKPIATEAPHTLAILGPHGGFKVKTCTVTREGGTITQNAMPKPGEEPEYQGNDIFDKAPDLLTRYSTDQNIKTFAETFNFSALAELRKNVYNAGRRSKNDDKVDAHFIPEIISTIDMIADETLKNGNDTLEGAIDDAVKNGGSSNIVLFESLYMGDSCAYKNYINYYYGKTGSSITKPEDCSIFRGSTDSGSTMTGSKLVEANRGYNVKNLKPDYDTLGKACIKKCKNDTECMTRGYWGGNSPINLNENLTNSTGVTNKTIVSDGGWFMDPPEKNNGFFNLKKHNLGASITPLLDLVGAVEVCLSTVNVVGGSGGSGGDNRLYYRFNHKGDHYCGGAGGTCTVTIKCGSNTETKTFKNPGIPPNGGPSNRGSKYRYEEGPYGSKFLWKSVSDSQPRHLSILISGDHADSCKVCVDGECHNASGRMNKDGAEDEMATMEEVYSPLNCYKGVGILVEESAMGDGENASCEVTYSIEDKIEWRCGTNNLEKGTVDFNDVHSVVEGFEELSSKTYGCDETPPSYRGCNSASIYIDGELFGSYAATGTTNCNDGPNGPDGNGSTYNNPSINNIYSFKSGVISKSFLSIINNIIPNVDAEAEDNESDSGPALVSCILNYKTIPGYIMHESPSSTELSTQVDGTLASALPVDKDKYIDFLGADLTYKKVNYPYLFRQEVDKGKENNIENNTKKLEDYLDGVSAEVNKVIVEQELPEDNLIYELYQSTGIPPETDLNTYLENLPEKEMEINGEKKKISYKDSLAFALYWKNIDNISEKYAYVMENYLSDQFNKDIEYGIPKNKKLYELAYMGAEGNATSMYVKMDPDDKERGNPYEEEMSKNASLDNMLDGLNLGSGESNDSNSSDEQDSDDGADFECGPPDGVPIWRWFPAILCWLKTVLPPTIKVSKTSCSVEEEDDDSSTEEDLVLSNGGGSSVGGGGSSSEGWLELDETANSSCDMDSDKNGINDCIEKGLNGGSIDLIPDSNRYNFNANGELKIGLLNSNNELLSYDNSTEVILELSRLELVNKDGTKEIVYNGSGSTTEEKALVSNYFDFTDTKIKVSKGKADYAFSTKTSDVDAYIKAWVEISNYKKTEKIYLEKTIKVEVRGSEFSATTYKVERYDDGSLNVLSGIDMVTAANSTNIYLVDGKNSNVEDKQAKIDASSTSKEKLIFSVENYTESGAVKDVKYPIRLNLYKDSEKIIDNKLINLSDVIDFYSLTSLKKSGDYILQLEDAEGYKIEKKFIVKADKAYRGDVVLGSSMIEAGGIITTNYFIAYDIYGNIVLGDLYDVEGEIDGDGIEFYNNGKYDDEIEFQLLEGYKVFRVKTTDDAEDSTIKFTLKDLNGDEIFDAQKDVKIIEKVGLVLQPLQTSIQVGNGKTVQETTFSGSSLTGSILSSLYSVGDIVTTQLGSGSEFNGRLSDGTMFTGSLLEGESFSGTIGTGSIVSWVLKSKLNYKAQLQSGKVFTGYIDSGSSLTGSILSDRVSFTINSFVGQINNPDYVIDKKTGPETGLYGYNFSVRNNDGEIIKDFNSRLYLTLNSIYGKAYKSYVDVSSGTGTVYFTTKQTASKDVKLSFQIEGLKNTYTKYIEILPEKPMKMDLILGNNKIEAKETDYTNLKVELKDRYGNITFNDNSTEITLELKEEYEQYVKPEVFTGVVSSGIRTFKINATKIPGKAYIKVKANPLFTSGFDIEGQAPFEKTLLTIEGFTDEKGLTETGRKFFEDYDSVNYTFKYHKLEDLENLEEFKSLTVDKQNALKTLWESNNSIQITPQSENIVEIETFYFWNKDKINGNAYNSLYTVLLGAEYGDITQKDYLAGGILFDKENRGLTVTSLLNNPYNYKDIVSINSAGKLKILENSQDLTQDIRYIANLDENKKLNFDVYNYAMSEHLGKIYYNLEDETDLKLCEGETEENFTNCAKELEETTILLKSLKEGYTGSIEDNSLLLKDGYGLPIFKVTENGEISHSSYVTIENYVPDGDESKEAIFSINEGGEIVGIFSYKLIDSELNVTRSDTLLDQKLQSLKNSVIVYLKSNKYGDRFVQTKEKDTLMIYYNDPFADEGELNNFSQSEGFTYESFKQNQKAGWSESNKALLLYAAGESVGESTKKYASFSLINLGDPVVKLKNVKKKFVEEDDDKPDCSEIEWRDGDICDRAVKSGLKVSIDAISVHLDQKITDLLANDSITVEVPVVGNPWVIYKDGDKRKAQTWERMGVSQKSKFRYALEESGVPLKNGAEIGFVVSGLVRMGTSNQKIKSATAWVTREGEDIGEGEEPEAESNTGAIYRSFNSTTGIQISKDEKNIDYKTFDYNNDKLQDLLVIKNDSYAEIIENRGNFSFQHKGNIVYIPEMGTKGMMEAGDFTGDGYADIFYVSKGKPILLNNVEKNFTKIDLEESFNLSGSIVKISSFDMDNDKIKDIVTMDSLGKIFIFYGGGTSKTPIFEKLEVGDGFTVELNEDKKDGNGAIYYDGLKNIDTETTPEDVVAENEELIENFDIKKGKKSINTQQIDGMLFDKISYDAGDVSSDDVFDDKKTGDSNFGDSYNETVSGMSGVEEYSGTNLEEGGNNTKQVSFIKNKYAKSFGINIEKKYEDLNKGTLSAGDQVKITIDITNNTGKAMKKVAYAEKIPEMFTFGDGSGTIITSKPVNTKFDAGNYDFIVDKFDLGGGEKLTIEYEVTVIPLSYGEIQTGYYEKGEAGDDEYGDILLKLDKKSCDTKPDIFRSIPGGFDGTGTLVHTGVYSSFKNMSGAYDLIIDGNYAYVTSSLGDKVNIVDITDKTFPVLTGSLVNDGSGSRLDGASGITKSGSILFVASSESDTIQVIDVSDPVNPTATGQIVNTELLDGVTGIIKRGNYLFVTTQNYDAIHVIDVSDLSDIKIVETLKDEEKLDGAKNIKIIGSYAYVTSYDGNGLVVLDVRDPLDIKIVGSIFDDTKLSGAWGVEVNGSYAYVSSYINNSIQIIDISDKTNPEIVSEIKKPEYFISSPTDLVYVDSKLYIASFGNDTISIVDVSDTLNPKFLTKISNSLSYPLLDGVTGLYNEGDIVYAASFNSNALEIMSLTQQMTYPGRAYEKGKIESICNSDNLQLPEEFQKNSVDEDKNGVPDYLDELTNDSITSTTKSGAIAYATGVMSKINEDNDGDGIPNDEDKTPTYNGEDADSEDFLTSVNEDIDTVSEGIDELSEGLCNGFGGGSCISSPVNWAPLAPGGDPVVLGYPVGDGQKVTEGLPIFAAMTTNCSYVKVWPPCPFGGGGRLDNNKESGDGQSMIRLFVTPTITGAVGLAICFGKNNMSKTESPPSLFPIVGTHGKCIIVVKPFMGCEGDGSDGDVSEKTFPTNFGSKGGGSTGGEEETQTGTDFSVANGSCQDTKKMGESKTFSFDDNFVKNYLDYKETGSEDTLDELVDTFQDIGKGTNNVLETEPIIELGGGQDKSDTVDISFVADIDVNALQKGDFKDVVKLKNNLIKSFPEFLMDWVNRQVDEIVKKLTTFPSIIIILPEFKGITDYSWGNFFDGIGKSFDKGKEKREKTSENLMNEVKTIESEMNSKGCSSKNENDEGYFECQVLDIQSKKTVLEEGYNPSQTTSGIKAVYDFIGSLPMVQVKSQTVNVNIPWITNSSLFKAKINFQLTKKQREEEIKRVEKARGSLDAAEKSAGDKIIVDAKALIRSLDKNISVLEEYKKFPKDLVELLNKKEERLEQILCNVDTIYTLFGGRLGDNGKRFKKWVELYILIKAILKTWQLILDLFDEYDKSCKECKNERYDLRTFIWRLVSMIVPKIPVIEFPKWPNIVIDLHNIKVGLNLTLPEFNFNTRPIVIPSLPKLYLPDVPSVKIKLPELPILPSIELPELPDLPNLPTVELPNLPPPPKLPKILSAIEAVLKILKIVTKIMCLIQHSPFAPEWTAATKIAYLSDRQGFNPLDYLSISMPEFSYSFVDSINITTYINFEVDAEFLLEFAKQGVKPLNNFTNDVVNLFNSKIPDLDFSDVVPEQVNVDITSGVGLDKAKPGYELTPLSKFIVYGFFNIYSYVNENKDETVSNEEFVYLVNKGLSSKTIVGDEKTQEIRKLWQDVANMTYSKEDKFIEELKKKNKAKFDTLKGIINTEKEVTKEQIKSIKNLENQTNIKFVNDIKKSNIEAYNDLMRKHNFETVKATINLLNDDNKLQKDLQKDGEKLANRLNDGLDKFKNRVLAANSSGGGSTSGEGSCNTGTGRGDQAKYEYNYKGIYIIEEGKNYRLFDYIEELSGDEELGHVDFDNDKDEDLIYMVKNEIFIKENTKIEEEKKKFETPDPLVLDIDDNKFYNGEIFYESLNNVKEAVSFDSYINFSFDAPVRDDVNNFRLDFFTIIDKYLNEDQDTYLPKGIMKYTIDSFSDINTITTLPEKTKTGYTMYSNLAYINGVGNNINENVVLETKELINIKDDLASGSLVSLSYDTKLYARDSSFTIKYYTGSVDDTKEISVGAHESIKFDEGIKVIGLSGDAYIESKETITLSGQTIKDYLYLPLFSGTKIYLEETYNPMFNESSHIDIMYYDESENNIDFRTTKQYELFDLGNKKSRYQVFTKEDNDFYYSRGYAFKDGIMGTKSNQALLAPQISSDTSNPEVTLDEPIKIPVYQKVSYNFTPYLYDTTGYLDFYIDLDLTKDTDNDGDKTNDRDTPEEDVQLSTKTVKVNFGPFDEISTKKVAINLTDLAGNVTNKEIDFEVYAPEVEVNSQTGNTVTGKISEELKDMPINLYRYRGGLVSKLLDGNGKQKIYTNSSGSYNFDIKTVNTKGLLITKDNKEIAEVDENTGLITIKNLVGARINVQPSNSELNDKSFVKVILEDSSGEIYYEYFDYNTNGDLYIVDNFKDANTTGIYLKINDLNNYSYYKIPKTAPYNPGIISLYLISDKDKKPLVSISPNGEINVFDDNYELVYGHYNDNVVFKIYDKANDKYVGEILMKVVDGNYIVR